MVTLLPGANLPILVFKSFINLFIFYGYFLFLFFFMLLPATVDLYFIRLMLLVIMNLWLVATYFHSTFITRWRCNHLIRVISKPSSFFHVLFSFLTQVPSLPIVLLRFTCSSLPLRVIVLRFRFTLFFASHCLFSWKRNDWHARIWTADPWSGNLLFWPFDHATPLNVELIVIIDLFIYALHPIL